ncbi:MAG: hypothetical protein QME42_01180 [bacterium]|nr:hypothetical protein [bacterium]
MLAVKGIYKAGQVIFSDQNLPQEKHLVIVTFLDEERDDSFKETSLIYKNPRLRKLLRFKKEDGDFIQSLHRARQKAYQQFIDNIDFLQGGKLK